MGNISHFLENESTFLGINLKKSVFLTKHPILHTIGSRAYLVAIRLRTRKRYAFLCVALFPQRGDSSSTTPEVPSEALFHYLYITSKTPSMFVA